MDGMTRDLPHPFLVIATQNPVGASGTQKLPDSQLDRFFVRLSLGYPDKDSATRILLGQSSEQMDEVQAVLTTDELLAMQQKAAEVHADESLCRYVVELTEQTRSNEYVTQGVSPRGSIAVLKMARAYAFYHDRDYLVPEDIHAVFYSVCNHRMLLNTKAKATGKETADVLMDIIDHVSLPKL